MKIINEKNIKIILMSVILLLIVVPLWFMSDKEKTVKENKKEPQKKEIIANTEQAVIKDETFEGLKFTNISLYSDKEYMTFTSDVINTNQTENTIENVYIDFKDKNGNVVVSMKCNIGKGLEPNQTKTVTAQTKGYLKNIVSKTIRTYKN